jgi:steroid delta-isomerase-like uncharacterized protein
MTVSNVVEHERIWVEGLNRGDVSAADGVFATDCAVHITGVEKPIRGVAAWKEFVAGLLTAFPDLHFTIEEQLADGPRVAIRWRATGTHRGPLGPVPATGRSITVDGLIIDHLEGGMVAERWEQWDQSRMLQQLGLA